MQSKFHLKCRFKLHPKNHVSTQIAARAYIISPLKPRKRTGKPNSSQNTHFKPQNPAQLPKTQNLRILYQPSTQQKSRSFPRKLQKTKSQTITPNALNQPSYRDCGNTNCKLTLLIKQKTHPTQNCKPTISIPKPHGTYIKPTIKTPVRELPPYNIKYS